MIGGMSIVAAISIIFMCASMVAAECMPDDVRRMRLVKLVLYFGFSALIVQIGSRFW